MTMDIPFLSFRGNLQVSPEEAEEFADGQEERKRHPSPVESGDKWTDVHDPIDGISSNKDQTRVVVGGSRGVLRIYRVTDNSIDFVVDMRQGRTRKQTLLYCPSYITWNKIHDDKLASTSTTGAVAIWSVQNTKILGHFKGHSRSATVVRWHPTRPDNIISGSKSCMVHWCDIRDFNNVCQEIRAGTEAVRDIAFSTRPGQEDIFLSADDGGCVKVWDLRKTNTPVTSFRPHQGYVSSIALNPREPTLVASGGGRDKLIKVWNWNDTEKGRYRPLFQVETIAPVGRVYWRPDHAWQIASCAVVNDQSILVWDIRRPHLPVVSFAGHKDSISDLWWSKEHPHRFVSAGKDGHIRLHKFAEGDKTLDHLCDANVDVAPDGLVAVTLNSDNDLRNAPKWERQRSTLQMKYDKTTRPTSRQRHAIVASRRLSMYDPFRGPIHSDLVLGIPDKAENALKPTLFSQLSKDFVLGEMSLEELCAHNAFVANHRGDERRSQIWRHIGAVLSYTDFQKTYTDEFKQKMELEERKWERYIESNESQGIQTLMVPKKWPEMPLCILSSTDVRRWRPKRPVPDHAQDPVRFLSTYIERLVDTSINIRAIDVESEEPKCDEFFGLPSEAFTRRRAIIDSIPNLATFEPEDGWVVQSGREDWEPRKILQRTLQYLAAQGDLQMCASIATVVGHRLSETISDFQVEIWIRSYIEMLERLEHFSTISSLYKWSWIRRLQQKTTEGTYLKQRVCHVRPKKVAELTASDPYGRVACTGMLKHGRCETCATAIVPICVLCDTAILGQMWACQRCHHAMHVDHAVTWFRREYSYTNRTEEDEEVKDKTKEEKEKEKGRRKITTVIEEDEEDLANYNNTDSEEDGNETEESEEEDSSSSCDEFITNEVEKPKPTIDLTQLKIVDRSNNRCAVRGCNCLCNLKHNDDFDISLFQRPRKNFPKNTATTRTIADRTEAIKTSKPKARFTTIPDYDAGIPVAQVRGMDTISTGLLARNERKANLLHNAFLASRVVDGPLRDSLRNALHPKAVIEDEEEKEVDRYYRKRMKEQLLLGMWKDRQRAEDNKSKGPVKTKPKSQKGGTKTPAPTDAEPPAATPADAKPPAVKPPTKQDLLDSDESDDEFGNVLKLEKKRQREFTEGLLAFSGAIYGMEFKPYPHLRREEDEVIGLRVRRRSTRCKTETKTPVRKLPPADCLQKGLVHKSLHEQRVRYGSGGRRRNGRHSTAGAKKYVPDYNI